MAMQAPSDDLVDCRGAAPSKQYRSFSGEFRWAGARHVRQQHSAQPWSDGDIDQTVTEAMKRTAAAIRHGVASARL
jgi:hypothetical protein